jgi:hypothetical protein
MSHRSISRTLKISHGFVSLEKSQMKKEEAERKKIAQTESALIASGKKLVLDEATPW